MIQFGHTKIHQKCGHDEIAISYINKLKSNYEIHMVKKRS